MSARYLSLFVAVVGLAVQYAWWNDIDWLKSPVGGTATMKHTTALMFTTSGVLVAFNLCSRPGPVMAVVWRLISMCGFGACLTVLVLAIAQKELIPALAFDAFGGGVQIDTESPGEPSIGTLACFMLIFEACQVGLDQRRGVALCMGLVAFSGLLALVGYALEFPPFYFRHPGLSTAMAVHTALMFILLAISALVGRPSQ